MNIRRLVWGRALPAVLILAAYSLPGAQAQEERTPGASGTLRVYVIDRRIGPMAGLQEAAASLTVRYRSGRGETVLLSRSATEHPRDGTEGAIRGLIGSGEFVEVVWKDGGAGPEPRAPSGDRRESTRALPPARDILHRAHQGPCFTATLPESRLGEIAAAWVTVRRGDLSWTSEEFQGPSARVESDDALLSDVDRSLRTLHDRANEGATFMMMHPQAVILIKDLAKLAPAGFRDDSGTFEQHRQWCLGVARAIDDSCAYGNWGQVATLVQECRPRIQILESLRPARPDVPTLEHQP